MFFKRGENMKKIDIGIGFAFIFVILVGIYVGDYRIPMEKILKIIFFKDTSDIIQYKIIWESRIIRVIMALIIGMLLGSSGAVNQTLFKNSMADPYIIGISASGAFGAMIAYILGFSENYFGIFGAFFSFLVSLIIFKLSDNKKGSLNLSTLLLIGIAISAFLRAITSLLIYLIGDDSFRLIVWNMGNLSGGDWKKIGILLIPLMVSLIYFFWNRYKLDLILLSDEEAHSLGVNLKKFKYQVLFVTTFMVGFSVAFSGMIGFVGLIIPHITRLLVGASNRKLVPYSMILGGIFLTFCDILSRGVITSTEIPIGVVTAILGTPFFIFLAIKSGKGIE